MELPLTRTAMLGPLALVLLYVAYNLLRPATEAEKFLASMPSLGVDKSQWFSAFRARLRSFSNTEEWMVEGYRRYSKKNMPFVVQNMRKGPVLALPPSQLKAIYSKPENQLNAHDPGAEGIAATYTMLDPAVIPNNYEVDVIRQQITKRFDSVTPELQEELGLAIDEHFGTSQEWHKTEVWVSVQRVMARGMNRVLVGFPLCRDPSFLGNMQKYAMEMPFQGFFITLLPKFLKPLLGPVIAFKSRLMIEAGIKSCLPIVEKRLKNYLETRANPETKRSPAVDILEWLIEQSDSTGNPEQMKARRIAHRLIILNFNLVQGGSLPFSLVLSDICSGPDAQTNFLRLRQEAEEILGRPSAVWDKATVARLVHIDSAIRESMRVSDFGLHALPRRVSAPDGLLLDGGIRVPKGVNFEVPMHGIHMDDDFYADAASFKPFRFVDGTSKPRAAHTLDETFLGFGYGRNGCPGRFFGTHVMKVILAYFVLNYEVEFAQDVPPMQKFFEVRIPKDTTILTIRRRKRD